MADELPPDDWHVKEILLSVFIPLSVATLFVIGRFYVRYSRHKIGSDDWFLLAGYVTTLVDTALTIWLVLNGTLRPVVYLKGDMQHLDQLLLVNLIADIFSIIPLVFLKTSVALLLHRVAGSMSRWRRWLLAVNIAIFWVISIVLIPLLFYGCEPVRASWHPELVATGQAVCHPQNVTYSFELLLGSYGAYLDFFLALYPITIVYNLQASLKKKLGICVLLGAGMFAGVSGVLKTIQFTIVHSATDPTASLYTLYLWSSLEIAPLIICSCIPPCHPLWNLLVHGIPVTVDSGDRHLNGTSIWGSGSLWGSLSSLFRPKSAPGADVEETSDQTKENMVTIKTTVDVTHSARVAKADTSFRMFADNRWTRRGS